jgi:hypothetical protein
MHQMKKMIPFGFTLLIIISFLGVKAAAAVIDSAKSGFSLRIEKQVQASSKEVYRVLVDDISKWWDSEHTFFGDAANLSIDARPGGCFCELDQEDRGVRYGVVLFAEPGKQLRLGGALGPLQGMAVVGKMTFQLAQDGTETKLLFSYNIVGYSPNGLDTIAPIVDKVLDGQLERLKMYVETGAVE